MKRLYESELGEVEALPDDLHRFTHLTSIVRSLLQVVSLTSLEALKRVAPDAFEDAELDNFVRRFERPTDGLPIETLDAVVPVARSYLSPNYLVGWFEGTKSEPTPLARRLAEWVELRNRKPGHGVLDKHTATEWSPSLMRLAKDALQIMGDALPVETSAGNFELTVGAAAIPLSGPFLVEGKPFVLIGVAARKGLWKLKAQQLDWEKSEGAVFDLPDHALFGPDLSNPRDKFTYCDEGKLSAFHNIPVRQTTTFEGRADELNLLQEWLLAPEDSRFCLIFGDGGYGKTTLVLEFLNRLLEGNVDPGANPPSLISYYTAKTTRWTELGITHFRGIAVAVEDGLRQLLYCMYPVLGADWYKVDGSALVDRVQCELVAQGFGRDDVLIVLDNTETLALSPAEVAVLSDFLMKVGKKIGRVVVTSRRREFLPATPIKVSALPEPEALRLVKRLADEYEATAVQQAGESRLRRACKKLAYKPLLLEAFVKYVARSSIGIDGALDQILKKTSDDLLEFLYQDAWLRLGELQRQVFLVLVAMAAPLDGHCVGDVCQEVGIQHVEFQSGLDETYFATVTDYGSSYEIEIVDLARRFFAKKLSELPPDESADVARLAAKADAQTLRRKKIQAAYAGDRVADAFRSQFAKAAKIAADRGDLADARTNYELAIIEEPMNAALHDRFAWFTLNRLQDEEAALPLAKKAVSLDAKNCDAHLTLGLIFYRLGDLKSGDAEINEAQRKGKSAALCLLRKGISRYHAAKDSETVEQGIALLVESERLIGQAIKQADERDGYYDRNMRDVRKYISKINLLRHQLVTRRLQEGSQKNTKGGLN